jgi:hypothetical protein
MKTIAYWASRHASLAIALIVLGEVINGINGIILGAAWLDTVSVATLHAGIAVVMSLAVGIRLLAASHRGDFGFRRWCLFGAFLTTLVLSGLLGGLMAPRSQPASGISTALGIVYRVKSRADTLAPADTLRPVIRDTATTDTRPVDKQGGKRAGFVLLFFLSFFLLYITTALACSIACAGYGFLALVVFLLGLGFLAGGIYFLGRAMDKQLKRRVDMAPTEKRRTGRRFWVAWGLLTGLSVFLLLISALSS